MMIGSIDELSAAWQALRDAVLGRSGMESHGSPDLVADVIQGYGDFREWYEPIADSLHSMVWRSAPGGFEQWDALRALTDRARAEGLTHLESPETPIEALEDTAQKLAGAAKTGAIAVGVLAALFLAFKLLGGGRAN